MKVEVGFSTTTSVFSHLVAIGTRSPASHCWVRVTEPGMPPTLIESVIGYGVCESLWTEWYNRPSIRVCALFAPTQDLSAGIAWVRKNHLGDPYDINQDVLDGLEILAGNHQGIAMSTPPAGSAAAVAMARSLLHPPPHPVLPPLWNQHKWNCSQIVDGILSNGGFPGCELLNPRTVTPADEWELMKRQHVAQVTG